MDQASLELVARLGGGWYCKVSGDNLFSLPKPTNRPGIGIDALPERIRYSKILTGNHPGMLAIVKEIPAPDPYTALPYVLGIDNMKVDTREDKIIQAHRLAARLLDENNIAAA